jgi:CheY-like chemotaxis protein
MKTILFVDDELEILQNYKEYFESSTNFHVVTVNSPSAALQRAENQVFDVICTDFRMPKLTGSDFISILRTMHGYKDKPILVITGYQEEAQAACEKLGNIFILAKPVKLESVCEIAKKLANKKS